MIIRVNLNTWLFCDTLSPLLFHNFHVFYLFLLLSMVHNQDYSDRYGLWTWCQPLFVWPNLGFSNPLVVFLCEQSHSKDWKPTLEHGNSLAYIYLSSKILWSCFFLSYFPTLSSTGELKQDRHLLLFLRLLTNFWIDLQHSRRLENFDSNPGLVLDSIPFKHSLKISSSFFSSVKNSIFIPWRFLLYWPPF